MVNKKKLSPSKKVNSILEKVSKTPRIKDLEKLVLDSTYLSEDRNKVAEVLKSNDINIINEYLSGLKIGRMLDLFKEKISKDKITSSDIQLLKSLFKKINDVDILRQEFTNDEINKYFSLISSPFAKKKYVLSYGNIAEEDVYSYIEYELSDSIDDMDDLVVSLMLEDEVTHSVIDLFISHLKNNIMFLFRLFSKHNVSPDYLQFISSSLEKKFGPNNLQSILFKYLLFSTKRMGIFKKIAYQAEKNNSSVAVIDSKVIDKIKKLDRDFFDYINKNHASK